MENSNNTPTAQVQSNNFDIKQKNENVVVKKNHILNGNKVLGNDGQFHPSKTMHEMTPGPKKYQNIKKSPDKEPKFVPYEPYKAAVRSIVPELGQPSVAIFKRRLSTASNCSKTSNVTEDKEDMLTVLTQEKKNLEKEIDKLNKQIANMDLQMGSQAQVNNELKNMLVASIGEDIEAKIQMLTEDKVLLAHKLLNFTGALAGRQDQLETVAGERDVLRSKFLAGSLIVEDLSKWKTFLCDRVDKLEASLQTVLDENRKNRHLLKSAHENLKVLQNYYKLEVSTKQKLLDSTTIAEDINRISLLLRKHLLTTQIQELQVHSAIHQTQAESQAQQILAQKMPREKMNNVDATCNAIMEASQALESNIQLCCGHCTGTVKLI
ncbi:golgin-45 isoform X3 [Melanaphis sacchari]|uniref:Golgin-45 n=1 Tax=Melanaphis sacchari TaxID=742174 RepID=A0A2H8TZ39_9HEMI|nr:golgin-45 isoform X1 [Melanaphis sacchari]XP_025204080.1 golgin-45 isoform X2 [Melanaphis sacchari]XP_025204082.1 golgin-45 isoform X3 [Melanaphis sacchari]